MSPNRLQIPWAVPAEWRAAQASRSVFLATIGDRAEPVRRSIAHLVETIADLGRLMSPLCRKTCVHCPDPCCLRASIWYDTPDALRLLLVDPPMPSAQPIRRPGDICRYASPIGCRLPRISRPWICTWYRCPEQVRRLQAGDSTTAGRINAAIVRVKTLRRQVALDFQTAMGGASGRSGSTPNPLCW